jgi:gamma-glutamylcyclotransferase (GGCT)/AIG2-like uncharacterized protein YtfP
MVIIPTDKYDKGSAVMDGETINRVFVYGTLKEGQANYHDYLREAKYLREISVPAMMMSFPGHPGIILHRDVPINSPLHNFVVDKMTYGQLFEIDPTDGTIESLDFLEGHPSHYKREILDLAGIGKFYTYALDAGKYLLGHRNIVASGCWYGTSTTTQEVNFLDGKSLPKVISWFSKDALNKPSYSTKHYPVIVPPNNYYGVKRYDDEWEDVEVEINTEATEVPFGGAELKEA